MWGGRKDEQEKHVCAMLGVGSEGHPGSAFALAANGSIALCKVAWLAG
jgi:hypothetical protein